MHPVSTILFIFGYALTLPALTRLVAVMNERHRLPFAGHQLGMGVALLGWLLRGRWVIAGLHLVWMVVARVWFALGKSATTPPAPGERRRWLRLRRRGRHGGTSG